MQFRIKNDKVYPCNVQTIFIPNFLFGFNMQEGYYRLEIRVCGVRISSL